MDQRNIKARLGDYVKNIPLKLSKFNQKYKLSLVFLVILVPAAAIGTGYWYFFTDPGLDLHMVSGTEYISNEEGQLIVRMTDYTGEPISDATCYANILFPNKFNFITNQPMTESTESGNYYYLFTTPSTVGIYEYTIKCSYVRNGQLVTSAISHSFHVSPALISMLQQLNETRVQLEDAKEELLIVLELVNESLEASVTQKIDTEADVRDQKMKDMGDAISEIFT
ncbi:hypothetical protein HOD83_01275 [Candidatus Woesearchaeota archaeon]|jgi:hypothetical protein|nr:hypothetical protein [Candidatus Woesearchaeota archaeon]MBT4248202.1 hypothetical protein [Candidatus Woesearchaeota archaeon]